MGAPVPEMNPADDASAETLLSSLRTIDPGERRKHASVYNYWLAIRRDREFPPIRDLDPLEISEAGPFSLLVEMIGGGEDAEVRHFGHAIRGGIDIAKVSDAPNPSLMSCIATRLPVVAACRDAFAFEDAFETADGKIRCWVTLLPFSATGSWIDFVYGFVSLSSSGEAAAAEPEPVEEEPQPIEEAVEASEETADTVEAIPDLPVEIAEIVEELPEPVAEVTEPEPIEKEPQPEFEPVASQAAAGGKAGFSGKFFEALASVGGFYGKPVEVELDLDSASLEMGEVDEPAASEELEESIIPEEPDEPAASEEPEESIIPEEPDEPIVSEEAEEPDEAAPAVVAEAPEEPAPSHQSRSESEGTLQSKLTDVRAKADEARQAKLRANLALYEGLSAAYDFALDAEDTPEEYLRLVEAEGLKIQLRSPMKPVAKLAFDGMCDEMTIKQLEAVLAWAFEEELPRGALAGRIEAAGGIGPILSGEARAA